MEEILQKILSIRILKVRIKPHTHTDTTFSMTYRSGEIRKDCDRDLFRGAHGAGVVWFSEE